MKIINLQLTNFQGIRDLDLQLDGHDADIFGDNATGKTTIFNAFTWLLFDKPSTGAAGFTPKTRGPEGDMHYLDHEVESVLELDDGQRITLRKVYHEVYQKRRGSASEEFAGHTTDYYIDGVPAKEKEYLAAVEDNLGPAETLKMLSMPMYFPETMSWEARRRILLDVCGDVKDKEVISSTSDLKDLPTYLKMPGSSGRAYSVDEYRRIAAGKKTEINRRLQEIPGRIDEATRALPNTGGSNPEVLESNIKAIIVQIGDLEKDRAAALAIGADAATQSLIADLKIDLQKARAEHMESSAKANEQNYKAIDDIKKIQRQLNDELHDQQDEIRRIREKRMRIAELRKELLANYESIRAEAWEESNETCSMCGQELPADKIDALMAAFNEKKSARLEEINARGQREASKTMIEELDEQIVATDKRIKNLEQQLQAGETALGMAESAMVYVPPFEQTPKYKELSMKIKGLQDLQTNEDARQLEIAAKFDDKIDKLQESIQALRDKKSLFTMAEAQRRRIDDLKAEERQLAGEYEDIERGIYLCDLFIRSKVAMLTDRINGKFSAVRYRLFQEQINGGLREDCEVLVPSEDGSLVPFAMANNAGRINAGLEIISTLSQHHGISMPVFVDNAESITTLLPMDTQIIRLIVSEADKQLRVEIGHG